VVKVAGKESNADESGEEGDDGDAKKGQKL
jgi:hypothetical protein